MQVEIRAMQCFVTLAEKLNFSVAASLLNMTQPTLSAQIRRLEHLIGEDLFIRTTRKVELSEFGQAILPAALQVVEAQKEFQKVLSGLNTRNRSLSRMGTPFYTAGIFERENLFRQFEVECPGISIAINYAFKQQLIDQLDNHLIDLALLIGYVVDRSHFAAEQVQADTSEIIIPDDLPRITLARRPVVMAVPNEHPLAQHGEIPLSAFDGQVIGMLDPRHGSAFTNPIVETLRGAGAIIDVPMEAHEIGLQRYGRERRVPVVSVGWFRPAGPDPDNSYHAIEGIDMFTELALLRGHVTANKATMQLWRTAERFAARNRDFVKGGVHG